MVNPGPNAPAAPDEPARSTRILVVADDLATQQMFSHYLEERSLEVSVAAGHQQMSKMLAAARYSLILLDLRRGQDDGLALLREVRARCDIPIIVTTDHRVAARDRVAGLELGADDYLTRPFGLRELLARIRAVLRRVKTTPRQNARRASLGRSRFGGWTLDRKQRRLTDPSGHLVNLTKSEHALLVAFLDAAQRCLSREFLLQAMHIHDDASDRSIDVQVMRLRRKLERDPSAPSIIQTERGIGYVFALPVVGMIH